MPVPRPSVFQYAIVRVVPRVERGECLNVGIILLCRPRRYLGARIALDSVVLPPVELAHCFVVTMPIKFEEVTPELVIRIHQIIQLEKPAHTNYYLQFTEEEGDVELREFFAIGLRSGIGIGAEVVQELPDEPSGEKKK